MTDLIADRNHVSVGQRMRKLNESFLVMPCRICGAPLHRRWWGVPVCYRPCQPKQTFPQGNQPTEGSGRRAQL